MPLNIVLCRPDIEISPHTVDQCSDWPAAESVKCHTKYFQWKILPCDAASRQNSL